MTFFSHYDQILPCFSQILPIFAMLNVIFDPFLTRKTPFFTLLILSRASDNTTSLNIGGTNAWAVPPPQVYLNTSPAREKYYLSDTSPAPDKPGKYLKTPFRRRRSIYTHKCFYTLIWRRRGRRSRRSRSSIYIHP